jgi:hypothetical protein
MCCHLDYVYCKIVSGQIINFHFSNMLQTGLEKNVFGNHFVTISKANARTPPAFASDPLKRLSTSDDREFIGVNTINLDKDAALPPTLQSGMYTSSTLGSGTAIHPEPEIVEVDSPSPIVTQFPEQESNFIRSLSPHGVWHENSLYLCLCCYYVCFLFNFSSSHNKSYPVIV